MTTPTKETQSVAKVAERVPQLFKYLGMMTVGYLLVLISFAKPFFELVRTGVVSIPPFLFLIIGSLILLWAVFNAVVRARPSKYAFIVAAILLATLCWKWYLPYLVSTVLYGALLAVGGLRIAYMKQ